MYKRILVPLDGSKLAEGVLPQATELANAVGATLILMQVAPGGDGVIGLGVPARHRRDFEVESRRAAAHYLARVAASLDPASGGVETVLATGPVAETIVRVAEEQGADVIALMSHGLGHAARWVFGSVADRLLRASPVPVLVVRAPRELLQAQEEYEETQLDRALLRAVGA